MAMSFTKEQLTALEEALAKGVTTIKYRDKVLTYRSLDEMIKLRNEIRKSLGEVCKGGRTLVSTKKGIC